MDNKEKIARRAARFLKDGELVNLGIGIPTLVGNFVDENTEVLLQSENGFIGLGPAPEPGKEEKDVVNAGGHPVTMVTGGSCFDSNMSFALIRGGHVSTTMLGAFEVDQEGSIANWMIPGKKVPGMGGAMDLLVGAKTVIITMEHTTKNGEPRILKKCTLPLTAKNVVDYVVTELCVIHFTDEGLVLEEVAEGVTVEEVIAKTEAELIIPEEVKVMM
ncbi:MAG: CoA transferase subunit B [Firmicutes bacterium]|nr:CoA transferase subunit B [Bacillota bacterium]MBR1988939.1 CoA transferase subunit B [Bacillota bacterium]MBR3706478.1 CoA transferase subunit B [Bacillota bacterium]